MTLHLAEISAKVAPGRHAVLLVDQAGWHILGTFAAMISGSILLPGKSGIAFGKLRRPDRRGLPITCGPIKAAFANAMLAQADETDDSNSPLQSHPGCSVVPATLALGEQFDIGSTRFLRAVALGYDVGCRVTDTLGTTAYGNEGHKSTYNVTGTFGSAATAGCATGLDAQRMRWLLDNTAQQSAGILAWQRSPDHVEKSFVFAGMPARNGVTAALLISQGWVGDTISSLRDTCRRTPVTPLNKMG